MQNLDFWAPDGFWPTISFQVISKNLIFHHMPSPTTPPSGLKPVGGTSKLSIDRQICQNTYGIGVHAIFGYV